MPDNPVHPVPPDVALGEIWRSQQRSERIINELDAKLDNMVHRKEHAEYVAESKAKFAAGETRLNDLETRMTRNEGVTTGNSEKIGSINTGLSWLVTTVIGAIIVGIVAFIFAGGMST